uniref:Uncharacterized protein n=1 Tax=Knipowitschia caucasica TaxID=637954 RepID=A0AAV2KK06_KNICA
MGADAEEQTHGRSRGSRHGVKISRWCTGRTGYLLLRGTWDIHGSRVDSAEQEEDAAKGFHSPLSSVTYHG